MAQHGNGNGHNVGAAGGLIVGIASIPFGLWQLVGKTVGLPMKALGGDYTISSDPQPSEGVLDGVAKLGFMAALGAGVYAAFAIPGAWAASSVSIAGITASSAGLGLGLAAATPVLPVLAVLGILAVATLMAVSSLVKGVNKVTDTITFNNPGGGHHF